MNWGFGLNNHHDEIQGLGYSVMVKLLGRQLGQGKESGWQRRITAPNGVVLIFQDVRF
jgi:hypothetical protein